MSLPLGHMAMSIPTLRRDRGWWFIGTCLLLTILPDFDMALGIPWGNLKMFHRQFSHSILFAVVVGHLLARFTWKDCGWLFSWLIFSHDVLDMYCHDPVAPYGMQLFWPFQTYVMASYPVFSSEYNAPLWKCFAEEVLFLLGVMGLTWLYKKGEI